MLLTCTVSSIAALLKPRGRAAPRLALDDTPAFIKDQLGMHGMSLSTDLLAGASPDVLDRLRDRADKAGCACLLLVEPTPQPLASEKKIDAAIDRITRVVRAASLLGCNSAAISIEAPDNDDAFDRVVDSMRRVMEKAERLDLNLLINPRKGLTARPERVTDLIKKIGGFRVGTLPDFDAAVASDDPEQYLRRLTPYASAVLATMHEFAEPETADDDTPGSLDDLAEMLLAPEAPVHTTFDIVPLLRAVASVGFEGTLSIDYRGGGDGTLGVMQSRDAIESGMEALAE
ncbi:MAG TPA: sugar phosphate isomerase/epimerase [Phycisphaerales bacterium]|nr:sugar phosphate isomerase/epimerase [Phycisphaerales bacterium]